MNDFVSVEMLKSIEESCVGRLAGNRDQHRVLSLRTSALLKRDTKRYIKGLPEDVECHLNAKDL